eukprot:gene1528-1907_t
MKTVSLRRLRTISLQLLAVAVTVGGLSSCKTASTARYGHQFDPPATRPTNPDAVKVKVSTGAQRIYVVEGNKVLLATPCSVGTGGSTGAGNYRITYKEAKRRRQSEPDRGYPMAYWMEWKS